MFFPRIVGKGEWGGGNRERSPILQGLLKQSKKKSTVQAETEKLIWVTDDYYSMISWVANENLL